MTHVIVVVMVGLFLAALMRGRASMTADGQKIVLKYHPMIIGIALAAMGLSLLLVYGGFKEPDARVICFTVAAVLFFLEGGLLWMALKTRVEFDAQTITGYGLSGQLISLHWMEVDKVEFKGSQFILSDAFGHSRIKVGMLLSGIEALVKAFQENLPAEKFRQAVMDYRKLKNGY